MSRSLWHGWDWGGRSIPGSGSGPYPGRETPELEMFKGNSRVVLGKELMGESFIYQQILSPHDVLGSVLDTEDILVDKTKIPVLMELICQKMINTCKMIVLN